MRWIRIVSCSLALIFLLSGCASVMAFSTAPPAKHHRIEIGMHRDRVEGLLEASRLTSVSYLAEGRTGYEYSDGPNPVWKVRGVLYLAADVVTLFLSELILWPIEILVRGSAERSGTAYYDDMGRLLYFQSVRGRASREVMSVGEVPAGRYAQFTAPILITAAIAISQSARGGLSHPAAPIPQGGFYSGCNRSVDLECFQNEKPGQDRVLDAFRIDITEVTTDAFRACVEAGGCTEPASGGACNWGLPGRGAHPQNCVDWDQAAAFCAWKGQRLPTEWEWEKAARGTDGRKFPWGNEEGVCSHAVIENEEGSACGLGATTFEVASMPLGISPYGVLDMSGNVGEWTSSREEGSTLRAVRGGSWLDSPELSRASLRGQHPADSQLATIGFRCAEAGIR